MTDQQAAVVLFDSDCVLCSRAVAFVAARDPRGRFHFAGSRSATAQRLLPPLGLDPASPSTIVLVQDGHAYTRSDAVLRIAAGLDGVARWLALLRLVPRPLRDAVYDLVARYRYRWFGRRPDCLVPTSRVRERLMD